MPRGDSPLSDRLVARANLATPEAVREFQPSASHEAIAAAVFEHQCSTYKEVAAAAGVSLATVYRALRDPAAVNWIVQNATNQAAGGLGAVHARLLHMALTSKNAAWVRLYLERFDDAFRRQKVLEKGQNTQFNLLASMSDEELEKWATQKRLRIVGTDDGPPRA